MNKNYRKKYLKYKKKYHNLRKNQIGSSPHDPKMDSYANYPPSPAGSKMLQQQLEEEWDNRNNKQGGESTEEGENNDLGKAVDSQSDTQRAGQIVEGCLNNCMRSCNYGIPLCISTNIGSFADSARKMAGVMATNTAAAKHQMGMDQQPMGEQQYQ